MKCLIVDDHPMARLALRNLCGDLPDLELSGECTSAEEAYNFLQKETIDLILLDVEMPDGSGLELLSSLHQRPLVILVTAKREYAVEAYEYNVVDYLVKPVSPPRFKVAIDRAREIFEAKNTVIEEPGESGDFIFVRGKNALNRINLSDILWIQALGDYVTFHTLPKNHTVHLTLRTLESRLPAERFIRIHRSYIVALDKIEAIEEGSICMIGRQALPISEQYKPLLFQRLNLL